MGLFLPCVEVGGCGGEIGESAAVAKHIGDGDPAGVREVGEKFAEGIVKG